MEIFQIERRERNFIQGIVERMHGMGMQTQNEHIKEESQDSASLITFPGIEEKQANDYQRLRSCAVALYSSPQEYPQIVSIPYESNIASYIRSICLTVNELLQGIESPFEKAIIFEMVSNFIHADFMMPSIVIADKGHTIIFSDHGQSSFGEAKNISRIGFSSVDPEKRIYIRGLGLGFPLIQALLKEHNGTFVIEKNLNHGCVITLHIPERELKATPDNELNTPNAPENNDNSKSPYYYLTPRQITVLSLVNTYPGVGPSVISEKTGNALSTAYRDLFKLESLELILSKDGKRTITDRGKAYLSQAVKGV